MEECESSQESPSIVNLNIYPPHPKIRLLGFLLNHKHQRKENSTFGVCFSNSRMNPFENFRDTSDNPLVLDTTLDPLKAHLERTKRKLKIIFSRVVKGVIAFF